MPSTPIWEVGTIEPLYSPGSQKSTTCANKHVKQTWPRDNPDYPQIGLPARRPSLLYMLYMLTMQPKINIVFSRERRKELTLTAHFDRLGWTWNVAT